LRTHRPAHLLTFCLSSLPLSFPPFFSPLSPSQPLVLFAGVDTCLSCRGDPQKDPHDSCLSSLLQLLDAMTRGGGFSLPAVGMVGGVSMGGVAGAGLLGGGGGGVGGAGGAMLAGGDGEDASDVV